MTLRGSVSIALLVFVAGACQPAAPDLTEADVSAIREASATYVRTALARDEAGWMAVSADDAVFMPPNVPRLETREARSAWFTAFPSMTSLVVTPVEIVGKGDLAFARGTYSFTMMPENATPITDSGSYVEIWRKGTDGVWRISRDIFNSELPVAQ